MLGYLILKRIIFSAYNIWRKIIFFQAFFEWILITLILYFLISNIYLIIYVFGIWLIGSCFLPKKAKVKAENKYNPFSNGSRKKPRQTQNEKTNKQKKKPRKNKQTKKQVCLKWQKLYQNKSKSFVYQFRMNANPCNNSDFEILLRVHGHIHKTWWWSIWKHLESVLLHKRAHLNNVINKLYQYFFKILSVETSPLYILMLTYVFYYLLLFILCHLHYKPPGQPVFNCTRHMSALVRFMWRSVFDLHRFVCILPPTGSQTAHENQKQSVLFSYSRRFFLMIHASL